MCHLRIAFALCALAALLCAGCENMQISSGSKALESPDGLRRVAGIARGTLFVRPNYAFGSYYAYTLAPTVVSFEQGSRVLDKAELEELSVHFKQVARATIAASGRQEVHEGGRCIARVTLGLVDLDLMDPEKVPNPAGGALRTLGSVTLVLEIRDGHTGQPLLRYGGRGDLEGRSANPRGAELVAVFQRFAKRFQRDFEYVLSSVTPSEAPLSCDERSRRSS